MLIEALLRSYRGFFSIIAAVLFINSHWFDQDPFYRNAKMASLILAFAYLYFVVKTNLNRIRKAMVEAEIADLKSSQLNKIDG